MEDRSIDIIDLIADILSHWKGLFVCMIIGALLLGGYSYRQSFVAAENARNEAESIQQQLGELSGKQTIQLAQAERMLSETQKTAVAMLLDDEQELSRRQQYIEMSILMDMDAYNISRTELVYKLTETDMRDSYMLGIVYEDMMNSVGLYQWIEEQTDISAAVVRELISVDAKTLMDISSETQRAVAGNDTMRVTIIHAETSTCAKIAEAVKSYVSSLQEQLVEPMGEHSLTLLSEKFGYIMDTGILDKQISMKNTCLNLQNNIAKAKDAFSPEQSAYYELLKEPEAEVVISTSPDEKEVAIEPIVIPEVSVSMKYVLVGAIMFAVLYAAFWFILYIMNGRLRTNDDVQGIYHIAQLGVVVKDSKKKFLVDKWVEQLRNHGKRTFTREQSLVLAATAVKISANKNEMNAVCLMGCDLSAGADAVCDRIKAELEKEQIKVTVLNNVLYDAAAMEQLESVQGVVLVEKAGVTMYHEIAEELELAKRQDIKVLGAIIAE